MPENYCLESKKVTVYYSYTLGTGILVTYPTDGSEDRDRVGGTGKIVYQRGWTQAGDTQIDTYRSRWTLFGTALGSFYFHGQGESGNYCGKPVKWVSTTTQLYGITDVFVEEKPSGDFHVVFPNGYSQAVNLRSITENDYSVRKWENFERVISGARAAVCESCYQVFGSGNSVSWCIEDNSVELKDILLTHPYYGVLAWSGSTWSTPFVRSKLPLKIENTEEGVTYTNSLEIDKLEEVEDIEISTAQNKLTIYKRNVDTNQKTLLLEFPKFSLYEGDTYQVVCEELEEKCPEGTCKVDCDTHYCCYDSEGISVKSFEK